MNNFMRLFFFECWKHAGFSISVHCSNSAYAVIKMQLCWTIVKCCTCVLNDLYALTVGLCGLWMVHPSASSFHLCTSLEKALRVFTITSAKNLITPVVNLNAAMHKGGMHLSIGVMLSADRQAWLRCRCVRENQELVAVVLLNGSGWGSLIGHSCIACHSLAVQVLTQRTRWGLSDCQEYTQTWSYTVTQHNPCNLWVAHQCEVTPRRLFSSTRSSSHFLARETTATHHAVSRAAFGCT